MPVYFISPDDIKGDDVTVSGTLLRHLRDSLRMQVGDTVWLATDGLQRYAVRISEVDRKRLVGRVEDSLRRPARSTPGIVLAPALLKHDKMDWVVQKSTELGVAAIQPVVTQHAVTRPAAARVAQQTARWQRIALEAAQQSERWEVPTIHEPEEARRFFMQAASAILRVILSARSRGASLESLSASLALPSAAERGIVLAVGPEGGWSSAEMDDAESHGFRTATMGSIVLRAETAAIAALSVLQHRLGNLG